MIGISVQTPIMRTHRVRFAARLLLAALALSLPDALATSTGVSNVTLKTTGTGCGSCHGALNTAVTVTITGASALNATQSGTYTLTATKSGIVPNNTRMGIDVADRKSVV